MFLGFGLICILGKELPVVIARKLVPVIRRPQDGLLEVITPLAIHNLTGITEQTGFVVLGVVGTFVSDEFS